MANFAWTSKVRELQPAALTVRAQVLDPADDGGLIYPAFFPHVPVKSIRLNEIQPLDDRPVSDRREWNGPGRKIPLVIPSFRDMEMVPIEGTDDIDEYEMQILAEATFGNEEIVIQEMKVRIPDRTDRLAMANYRRLELDGFTAWQTGTVVVRNPQDGKSYTVSFNFDSGRYEVAGTAWNNGALNAYDEFIAFYERAVRSIGALDGVACRLPIIKEIQKDAPTLANGVKMTRSALADRIEQDTGHSFRFIEIENTCDPFVDGGATKTRSHLWNTGRVAAVPKGGIVGSSYMAPVNRAMDLSNKNKEARIDIRDNAVFIDPNVNSGKTLHMEVQMNGLIVPNERRVFTFDTGITVDA